MCGDIKSALSLTVKQLGITNMNFEYKKVETKEELINLIFELLDDNDAVEWENDTAYSFLQSLAAWLDDSKGFYKNMNLPDISNTPSWQLIADALQGAVVYE